MLSTPGDLALAVLARGTHADAACSRMVIFAAAIMLDHPYSGAPSFICGETPRSARRARTPKATSQTSPPRVAVAAQSAVAVDRPDHANPRGRVEERPDPFRCRWRGKSVRSLLGDASLQLYIVLDSARFRDREHASGPARASTCRDRDFFQAQRASRRSGLFVGPAIRWKATGRWEINLSRRLERERHQFCRGDCRRL